MMFLDEYITIGIFIIASFVLALILLGAVYILSFTSKIDLEKSSPYECGFQPFSEAKFPFQVRFAIIAILFLLFDIELLYLYPCAVSIYSFSFLQAIYLTLFFIILTFGIFLEIMKNLLEFTSISS